MKRLAVAVLLLVGMPALSAKAGLDDDIQKVLGQKLMSGRQVGIEVWRLGASVGEAKAIYSKDAGVPRMPASNLKLVTTAAALDRLGADFKFRTKLLQRGNDVILVGDGDPTMGDADLLEGTGWGTTTLFEHWAAALKKKGITSVGDVIVDDSVFDEVMMHPHWSPNQYAQPHSAEVGGVAINENCVNVTVRGTGKTAAVTMDPSSAAADLKNTCAVGNETRVAVTREKDDNTIIVRGEIKSGATGVYQCTVHDPPLFAAGALANVLQKQGITVTGKVRRDRSAAAKGETVVIGVNETPLPMVIARANKVSQNLYAESLCKRLGHEVTGEPGSWANGTAAVGDYLKKIGVDPSDFKLDDGCGLSRENGIAAHAMCKLLVANYYGPNKETFISSLAQGGEEGTLEHRFSDAAMKGKVFAKTGFIEGVSALSGYVQGKDGNMYVFSILINGIPPKSNSIYKDYQDRIVRAISKN